MKVLRRYMPLVALVLVVAVFFVRLFFPSFVHVDWITVALLILIAFLPYIDRLQSITLGDVQMDLRPEIERTQEEVEQTISERETRGTRSRTAPISDEVYMLAETDYAAALLKLRMEIEKTLRKIAATEGISSNRRTAIALFHELEERDTFEKTVSNSIRDVLELSNRVVHGGTVREEDANDIINLGIEILNYLNSYYYETMIEPEEQVGISQNEVEESREAVYEVTTIIPLVDNPQKVKRTLTQEALDDFLEGYNEHAEFIISVEKIEKT